MTSGGRRRTGSGGVPAGELKRRIRRSVLEASTAPLSLVNMLLVLHTVRYTKGLLEENEGVFRFDGRGARFLERQRGRIERVETNLTRYYASAESLREAEQLAVRTVLEQGRPVRTDTVLFSLRTTGIGGCDVRRLVAAYALPAGRMLAHDPDSPLDAHLVLRAPRYVFDALAGPVEEGEGCPGPTKGKLSRGTLTGGPFPAGDVDAMAVVVLWDPDGEGPYSDLAEAIEAARAL